MILVKRLGMDRAQGRAGMPRSTRRVTDSTGEDVPRAPVPECWGVLADSAEMWTRRVTDSTWEDAPRAPALEDWGVVTDTAEMWTRRVTDCTGEDVPRAPAPEDWGVLADTAEMWDCILCSFRQGESWRTRRDQGGMDWILFGGGEGDEGVGVQAQIYSRNAGF